MLFVLDFGNARVKWSAPRLNAIGDFRHAIVQLTDGEWRQVVGRGAPPRGIIKVNGIPYAVGDAAVRYTIPERPRGAARYKATYYGVAMAYALAEGIGRSNKNILLYASHAPGDIDYARHLIESASGVWRVESRSGELQFAVNEVRTFDEPLGGYTNFVFNADGTEARKNPLRNVSTLVVDIGGYTVDVAAVDPGGEIDLLSLHSTRTGIINLTEGFEAELRSENASLFQDTGAIDIRRIEDAIITGVYRYGKVNVDCAHIAAAAVNSLVNQIVEIVNHAGGVANYDYLLLTGGGPALVYNALQSALPRAEILLSEKDKDQMRFSNVNGGGKLAALMRRMGA